MEENQLQIPEGWDETNVNEISISINDKRKQIKSSEYLELGSFPVIDQSEKFICGFTDEKDKVIFEKLPVTIFGDHTRHTKFINFPFVCGADGTQVLKPKEKVDDKFFYYLISNASILIGNHGYDRHFKHLKEFKTTYPKDKTEQTTIANILSKTEQAIANTEALIAKYTRIKKGLMQDLLTKGIDENGNIRSEQTHEFKDSPLGRIPQEWEIMAISDLGEWKGGKTPSKSIKKYWNNASNLWYSSRDIETNYLNDSFYKISDDAIISGNQTVFPAFVSIIFVFRSGILRHTFPIARSERPFSVNQDIKVLIPKPKYSSDFLAHTFKSLEPYFLKVAVKAGTTVESIDGNLFFKTEIGIPNIKEQKTIEIILNTLDNQINSFEVELTKLQSLKTGLMQDLLSGKVRVNNIVPGDNLSPHKTKSLQNVASSKQQ
jgi:type I restriction enzyme S subunit